jgi:hypothetical protein
MAAPNIVSVATITPHTATVFPTGTSRTALVAAPSTGMAYKINQIMVANIDGTNAYTTTVETRLADGTTYGALASTISVPANSTIIISDKTTMFYLVDTSVTGEACTLWATSSTGSKLLYTVSYEAIS